jgi:hypothetical protein
VNRDAPRFAAQDTIAGEEAAPTKESAMDDNDRFRGFLEVLSSFLLRCFLLGVVFLLYWFFVFIAIKDTAWAINERLFSISKENFNLVNYYGMAITKCFVILVFLIPYLATRLVLRKLHGRRDTSAAK